MRPPLESAFFAVVTASRADGLRAEALAHQHAEAGVAPPPPPAVAGRPRRHSTSRLLVLASIGPLLAVFPLFGAATMPASAVDYGTKVIMLSIVGGALSLLTPLRAYLAYHFNRREIREYDAREAARQHDAAVAIDIAPPRGLESVPQSEHLPKSLTDPHPIGQLFSDGLESLLSPPVEAIIGAIIPTATAEQFVATMNHIFADTPIDPALGHFDDAKTDVGNLLNNRLNYRPTDRSEASLAENETRDDVAIQFLTLIYAARYLHKNPTLLDAVNRVSLMEACQDFYDKTFVPHCKKNYGQEGNILDGAWTLFSEVAQGREINIGGFTALNERRAVARDGGAEERKYGVDGGEIGGGGGGGGGGPSGEVVAVAVAAAVPAAVKEL